MFVLLAAYASQAATAPMLKGLLLSPYDYPASATNHGDEGAARFTASISPDGRVYACDIVKSSGTPALDRATCKAVRRFRADPARDVTGAPIYGVVAGWMDWTLNGAPVSTYVPAPIGVDLFVNHMPRYVSTSDLRLILIVDRDGHVDDCYVATSAATALDALACKQARGFSQIPSAKDAGGNPVRSAQAVDVRFHSGPMPAN